jgi:hypothetical protein
MFFCRAPEAVAESGIPNFEPAQNLTGFSVAARGGGGDAEKTDQFHGAMPQEKTTEIVWCSMV